MKNTNQLGNYQSFSWHFELDHINDYAYWEDFLSSEECDNIVEIGKSKKIEKGVTGNNNLNKNRDSNISWLAPDNELVFLYKKLTNVITSLNDKYFKFDLFGFTDGLQFTNYKAPSGKYDEHVDRAFNVIVRKLSVVILLSDVNDFKGGEFELITGDVPTELDMQKGKLFLFPSFILHRVKPIIEGERNSLVGWVTGSNFK